MPPGWRRAVFHFQYRLICIAERSSANFMDEQCKPSNIRVSDETCFLLSSYRLFLLDFLLDRTRGFLLKHPTVSSYQGFLLDGFLLALTKVSY